jgi:hypothetical protein
MAVRWKRMALRAYCRKHPDVDELILRPMEH